MASAVETSPHCPPMFQAPKPMTPTFNPVFPSVRCSMRMFYRRSRSATIGGMPRRVGFWLRAGALAIDLVVVLVVGMAVNTFVVMLVATHADAHRIGSAVFFGIVLLYSLIEVPLGA